MARTRPNADVRDLTREVSMALFSRGRSVNLSFAQTTDFGRLGSEIVHFVFRAEAKFRDGVKRLGFESGALETFASLPDSRIFASCDSDGRAPGCDGSEGFSDCTLPSFG